MCVGPFAPPKAPPMPAPVANSPAPTVKNTQRAAEYVKPEEIKDNLGEDKVDTKKKKALEIAKVKKGVGEFAAIDPSKTGVDTPAGGINTPV